jgi:nucleoside-diphosphate kinase
LDAAPGSIRGDFAIETGQNLVHGSDSPESARREAELFFPE